MNFISKQKVREQCYKIFAENLLMLRGKFKLTQEKLAEL